MRITTEWAPVVVGRSAAAKARMGRTSETRERLLRVAFDQIWGESYGAVSVDRICQKAGVQKGSFYHFFPSKSDLAVAAYEEYWRGCEQQLGAVFASEVPPLRRIEDYCGLVYEVQRQRRRQAGRVLGCPVASIGAELSTRDEKVRHKAVEMCERVCGYLEGALRDAQRAGLIGPAEVGSLALSVHAYIVGMLVQARIRNDVELLRDMAPIVKRLVGAGLTEIGKTIGCRGDDANVDLGGAR